jgi:predicted RNA methylase
VVTGLQSRSRGASWVVAVAVASSSALVAVGGAAASHWTAVVTPYLRIHAALAADTIETVKADATLLAAEAAELGDAGRAVAVAAKALAGAADLEAARAAFMTLSEALVTAAGEALPPGVRVAYCPMVKKPWLQRGDTIQNPYFGSKMPTCGYFKKTS